MPSWASPAPTEKSLAGRHWAFHPDWRNARTGTGDIQHRRFTTFQRHRLHIADFLVTVIQRHAHLHRVDFALATALGGHRLDHIGLAVGRDRKSTRLNSSHITTSYADFCLKKKKKNKNAEENNKKNNKTKLKKT